MRFLSTCNKKMQITQNVKHENCVRETFCAADFSIKTQRETILQQKNLQLESEIAG
jgi:hypothetical protein